MQVQDNQVKKIVFTVKEVYDIKLLNELIYNFDIETYLVDRKKDKEDLFIDTKAKTLKTILNDLYNFVKKDKKKKDTFIECKKEYGFIGREFGRVYYSNGSNGYLYLPKIIRNFLAKDLYKDIDMVNAHPVLLKQLAAKYDLHCNELDEYISNRDICFEKYKFKKTDFLTVMYNDKPSNLCDFLNKINFFCFCILIPKLKEVYREDYVLHIEDKKENIDGSFLSLILQDLERKVLSKCVEFCDINNIKYSTLMYDGFFIYFQENINVNKLSDFIFKELGYKVSFEEKKMDVDGFDKYLVFTRDKYIQWVKQFEIDNFYKIDTNTYYNITYKNHWDLKTFKERMAILSNNYKQTCNYIDIWVKSIMKKYEGVDFIPSPMSVPFNIYNSWDGFHFDKKKTCESSLDKRELFEKTFNNLILHICENNEDYAKFMYQHLADIVQNPGYKNGISVVFSSVQGSGKGIFATHLKEIFKEFYLCCEDSDKVFGRFNGCISNKLILFFDESVPIKMIESDGKFKNLITQDTIQIEEKGRETLKSSNNLRIFLATNSENPILISESDRRFVVFKPNKITPEMATSTYDIINEYKDEYFYHIFNLLKNTKIEYKNMGEWQKFRPTSNIYKDIQQNFIKPELLFLLDFIEAHNNKVFIETSANELYQHYNFFMNRNKKNFIKSEMVFFKFLSKFDGIENTQKQTNNIRVRYKKIHSKILLENIKGEITNVPDEYSFLYHDSSLFRE